MCSTEAGVPELTEVNTLTQLVPWEGAKLRMAAMGKLKKPQRATFNIPGKYEYQAIVVNLQRRCPDLGVEVWRMYA